MMEKVIHLNVRIHDSDVREDWTAWLVVLASGTLLLNRANTFPALWSLVQPLQATSFNSRARKQ